jgi:hypothetical protein
MPSTEQTYPSIAPVLKEWVAAANVSYRMWLTYEADKKHRTRLLELQKEQERAEQKARAAKVLADLL